MTKQRRPAARGSAVVPARERRSSPHARRSCEMRRRGLHRVTGTAVLLAVLALLTSVSTASADVVHLKIKEARTVLDPGTNTVIADQNAEVTAPYTWLLSRDVTGNPDDSAAAMAACRPAHGLAAPSAALTAAYANYPENCDWPSIHAIGPGTAPSVVMTGNEATWNNSMAHIDDLPNGKYMVSAWADGYEVAGGWFEVTCAPGTAGCSPADKAALVYAERNPVPTSTLRIDVFQDNLPTNGQYDVGSEVGLNDFTA